MLCVDRINDLLQFLFVILFAGHSQNFTRFINPLFLHEPARTAWNAKKHEQKKQRWQCRNSQFESPLQGAQSSQSQQIVGKIREKNSEHDIELKKTDQTSPPFRRREFGYG